MANPPTQTSERNAALYKIISEHPGCDTYLVKAKMAEQYPHIAWLRNGPANYKHLIDGNQGKGLRGRGSARWYTRTAWAELNAKDQGTGTTTAPAEATTGPQLSEPTNHTRRWPARNFALQERSEAIVAIVAANPGIGTGELHDIFTRRYPNLKWSCTAARNLKARLVNATTAPRLPAVWYTVEQWAALGLQLADPTATQPKPAKAKTAHDPANPYARPAPRTAPSRTPLQLAPQAPARPDALQAFTDCPSRRGEQLVPYSGIKPMCVGAGPATGYGAGRLMGQTGGR